VDAPNVLVILTDQERYPPPYEDDAVRRFRRERLAARESLRDGGLEFHRHYVGATACLPSRATLLTGQYPSLHGAAQTDGIAKRHDDPAMHWLDPDQVPTIGDWFRAGGYQSHYRGKWHVSHADLLVPGTHDALMTSDDEGRVLPAAVDAYRRADRLDPFGFSGWIGREPHGSQRADSGTMRDGIYAEQVVELFAELAAARDQGPWFTVASFVNPHDIAFNGFGWEHLLLMGPVDGSVPAIPEAPSQSDSFAGRPPCHEQWKALWPKITYEQEADGEYRRLYYHLQQLVDRAIARLLESLDEHGMTDDTIIVFSSDHGDLLGSHGGLMQKWYNAYDETIRVPFVVKGQGVARRADGIGTPTSHVDLIPTLLGLAGIDVEQAQAGLAETHTEVHDLPGRDLSGLVRGAAAESDVAAPVYFMTEDDISRGQSMGNLLNGEPYDAVDMPGCVESVVAALPAVDGTSHLWKLSHYYERLDEWSAAHGIAPDPFAAPAAEPMYELYDLTLDPEERANLAASDTVVLGALQSVLGKQRDAKRLLPGLRNPS
jgi:arylsulfatase A-like enzyme